MKNRNKSPKAKALAKLGREIKKDIDNVKSAAHNCGLFEFLFFIYLLRINRHHKVTEIDKSVGDLSKNSSLKFLSMSEESLKYMISLVAKYGYGGISISKNDLKPFFDFNLVKILQQYGNLINSKYEFKSLLEIFNVNVTGNDNRFIEVDMSNMEKDLNVRKYMEYYCRIDLDNDLSSNQLLSPSELYSVIKSEYAIVEELFIIEFGVNLEEFINVIDMLLNVFIGNVEKNQSKFDQTSNGDLDLMSTKTIIAYSNCFVVDSNLLHQSFDEKSQSLLQRFVFQHSEFNENQLRFHQVTRQPIFKFRDYYVISPELIMDSILINIHYSMLESPKIKQKYIKIKSELFLDKIATIANKHGYTEIDREVELYEGKEQIGDIDIILRNDKNHFVLVEAKNHSLPLDVYFKDLLGVKNHLIKLKREWENKVKRRIKHIEKLYSNYSIDKNHVYIVVSRYPEIISHYSDIWYLCENEFDIWLSEFGKYSSFSDLYKKIYKPQIKLTSKEFEIFKEASMFVGDYYKNKEDFDKRDKQ